MEHQGIEAHSSTAPKNQKQNQNGITIPSTVDQWIEVHPHPPAYVYEIYIQNPVYGVESF